MKIIDFREQEYFMGLALDLARECVTWGDVPVGCVVVRKNEIIGRGQNRRELNSDAIAHAETQAIAQASQQLNTWRLSDCALYVTLEPCAMCTGAIIMSKIEKVYFGAYESKTGCCGSVLNLCEENLGHKPKIYGGILEEESQTLLQDFFQKKRIK